MNIAIFHCQLISVECPCTKACRVRPPLDDLAERLRDEMRCGRDAGHRPAKAPGVTADMAAAFRECPTRN
jgi:hypothetical protein